MCTLTSASGARRTARRTPASGGARCWARRPVADWRAVPVWRAAHRLVAWAAARGAGPGDPLPARRVSRRLSLVGGGTGAAQAGADGLPAAAAAGDESTIRLFLALLFSISFLVLVQTSRPFVDASSQFATVASQTILCFTRVLALLFKSVKSLPAGVDLQRALASRPPSGSRRRSSASTLRCSCSRCCLS